MSEQEIRTSAKNNPDGFGMAYLEHGKVQVHKTFNLEEIIALNQRLPSHTPIIYHFRIATHGTVKLSNCHPFYDKGAQVAFAHNGILSIDNDAQRDWTDSETAFRYLLVPLIKAGHKPGSEPLNRAINCIIGTSKFALLDKHGNIYTYGRFPHQEDGLLFSNDSYKEREMPNYSYYPYSWGDYWDDWEQTPPTLHSSKGKRKEQEEYLQEYDAAADCISTELEALRTPEQLPLSTDEVHYYAEYFYTEYGMLFDHLTYNDFKSIVREIQFLY